jgi:hypothetical protein
VGAQDRAADARTDLDALDRFETAGEALPRGDPTRFGLGDGDRHGRRRRCGGRFGRGIRLEALRQSEEDGCAAADGQKNAQAGAPQDPAGYCRCHVFSSPVGSPALCLLPYLLLFGRLRSRLLEKAGKDAG